MGKKESVRTAACAAAASAAALIFFVNAVHADSGGSYTADPGIIEYYISHSCEAEDEYITPEEMKALRETVAADLSSAPGAEPADDAQRASSEYTYTNDFYYSMLKPEEKALYNALRADCESFCASDADYSTSYYSQGVEFDYSEITADELRRVYRVFFYSNPEFFFLENGYKYSFEGSRGWIFPRLITEMRSGQTRSAYKSGIEKTAGEWLAEAMTVSDPLDREKLIYEKLIDKVTYTSNPSIDQTIAGALADGACVCSGYAMSMVYLCNAAGIDCILLDGNDHVWNAVKLYGRWYQIDTTWMDQSWGIWNAVCNVSYNDMLQNDKDGAHIYDTKTYMDWTLPEYPYSGVKRLWDAKIRFDGETGRLSWDNVPYEYIKSSLTASDTVGYCVTAVGEDGTPAAQIYASARMTSSYTETPCIIPALELARAGVQPGVYTLYITGGASGRPVDDYSAESGSMFGYAVSGTSLSAPEILFMRCTPDSAEGIAVFSMGAAAPDGAAGLLVDIGGQTEALPVTGECLYSFTIQTDITPVSARVCAVDPCGGRSGWVQVPRIGLSGMLCGGLSPAEDTLPFVQSDESGFTFTLPAGTAGQIIDTAVSGMELYITPLYGQFWDGRFSGELTAESTGSVSAALSGILDAAAGTDTSEPGKIFGVKLSGGGYVFPVPVGGLVCDGSRDFTVKLEVSGGCLSPVRIDGFRLYSAKGLILSVDGAGRFDGCDRPFALAAAGDRSVALSWEEVPGAVKYAVSMSDGSGRTLISNKITSLSYTVAELEAGKEYSFVVQAYNGKKWSAGSNTVSAVPYSTVPIVCAQAGDRSAALSWQEVPGAVKYAVSMSDGSGRTLLSNRITALSYTVAELESGKEYSFVVQAYNGKKWSAGSNTVSAVPYSTVPIVFAQAGDRSAALSWQEVPGAVKYAVSMSDGSGRTLLSNRITALTYTVQGLEAGKEYSFVVQAYNGKKWSAGSNTVSAVPYSTVPIVCAQAGDRSISLSWQEVPGAVKYAVSMSDGSGRTLLSNRITALTYTVQGLEAGKEYSFVVQAFNGKKWSAYGDCIPAAAVAG